MDRWIYPRPRGWSSEMGRTRRGRRRTVDGERTRIVHLFNEAKSSVVYITNVAVRRDAFTLNLTETPQGAGSGIVWDDKGHLGPIITLIAGANQLKVSFYRGKEACRIKRCTTPPSWGTMTIRTSLCSRCRIPRRFER